MKTCPDCHGTGISCTKLGGMERICRSCRGLGKIKDRKATIKKIKKELDPFERAKFKKTNGKKVDNIEEKLENKSLTKDDD